MTCTTSVIKKEGGENKITTNIKGNKRKRETLKTFFNHFQKRSCIHITAQSTTQDEPPIGLSSQFVVIPG